MIQRQPGQPQFRGLQNALAQQPRAVPPQQPPMWNGQQDNPWQANMAQQPGGPMQGGPAALQGMARQLGQQSWGDPGDGAPVVQNPSAGRNMAAMQAQQAQATQGSAAQYARGAQQRALAEDDPRLQGIR
jgi:hypothetical protein